MGRPAGGAGLCGTITAPLASLRPKLELAVHLHTDAVGHLTGAARIDGAGHITTALLADLIPGVEVSVQPVIDLPELAAEDRYVPSVRLKKAILIALDRELFPYSTRRSKGLDVDHTEPFTPVDRGRHGSATPRPWGGGSIARRPPGTGASSNPGRVSCTGQAHSGTATKSPLAAPACSPRNRWGWTRPGLEGPSVGFTPRVPHRRWRVMRSVPAGVSRRNYSPACPTCSPGTSGALVASWFG